MTAKRFFVSIGATILMVLLLIPWDVYGLNSHSNMRYQTYHRYVNSTGHVLWIFSHIVVISGLIYYLSNNNNNENRSLNILLFILTVSPVLSSIAYNIQMFAWQEQQSVIQWIFIIILAVFLYPTYQYYLILSIINQKVYVICLGIITIYNWITASYVDPIIDGNYEYGVPFYIMVPLSLLFTVCSIKLFMVIKTKNEPFLIFSMLIYIIILCVGLYTSWKNIYYFIHSISGLLYCIFCSYLVTVMNLFIIVQVYILELQNEEEIYEPLSTRTTSMKERHLCAKFRSCKVARLQRCKVARFQRN
eukprot:168088_1